MDRIDYKNGYHIGEVIDGKANGKGEYLITMMETSILVSGKMMKWMVKARFIILLVDRNGHGIFYDANGDRVEGDFLNDWPIGELICYFKDGRIERQNISHN